MKVRRKWDALMLSCNGFYRSNLWGIDSLKRYKFWSYYVLRSTLSLWELLKKNPTNSESRNLNRIIRIFKKSVVFPFPLPFSRLIRLIHSSIKIKITFESYFYYTFLLWCCTGHFLLHFIQVSNTLYFLHVFVTAFSANGKDVIVDFPQQSHWTGLLSEMELVPSIHPGVT